MPETKSRVQLRLDPDVAWALSLAAPEHENHGVDRSAVVTAALCQYLGLKEVPEHRW